MADRELLVASNNRGKILEIRQILAGLELRVCSPRELELGAFEYEETGRTFRDNALGKARAWSEFSGRACLADDSGLCVEALEGAPGVYSARFAGEPGDDRRNNEKLLECLREVPDGQRQARFVCCLALYVPEAEPQIFEGQVQGMILREARGANGFGYDPLFFHPPSGQTFAEIGAERKNRVSHRAQALERLRTWLTAHPQWL